MMRISQFSVTMTMPGPNYMTRWHLSDMHPEHIKMCEGMARLVANTFAFWNFVFPHIYANCN